MFDFTPVGAVVAACGVLFVAVAARWLVPSRKRVTAEEFDSGTYLTEARVPEKAKAAGMTLHEIERALDEADAQIIGFVRRDIRIAAPERWRRVQPGDVLIIEADPKALASVLSSLNLELEETVRSKPDKNEESIRIVETTGSEKSEPEEQKEAKDTGQPDEITLTELAILPESALLGRSASDVRIRTRFGVNLLAISRQGRRSISRLRTAEMHAGDVLLMQGTPEAISEFANQFACVPLAQRALRLPDNRQALTATGIMAVAIAGAAFGLVPAAIAFIAGVLAAMATRIIPPRTVYEAVDWPVIVLLGALIPVAGAMATTGAADLIAHQILGSVAHGDAFIAIVVVLILTMTLSDFMNNAATAAVMCPIAIGAAAGLGVSADPFLMAVAVGASCAFLTPIGHQNNTLILGPGGFRFGDYWRMGLPLEVIVIAVGAPMLLHVWPL
jgi:di/tricarboxylate transporter